MVQGCFTDGKFGGLLPPWSVPQQTTFYSSLLRGPFSDRAQQWTKHQMAHFSSKTFPLTDHLFYINYKEINFIESSN
jgi:hypothetical protein